MKRFLKFFGSLFALAAVITLMLMARVFKVSVLEDIKSLEGVIDMYGRNHGDDGCEITFFIRSNSPGKTYKDVRNAGFGYNSAFEDENIPFMPMQGWDHTAPCPDWLPKNDPRERYKPENQQSSKSIAIPSSGFTPNPAYALLFLLIIPFYLLLRRLGLAR